MCVYTIGFIHSVLMRTAFQFMFRFYAKIYRYMYTYISTLHISTFCYKRPPFFAFIFDSFSWKEEPLPSIRAIDTEGKKEQEWGTHSRCVCVLELNWVCMNFPIFHCESPGATATGHTKHTIYWLAKRKPWRHRMWFIKLHDLEKRFSFIPFVNISIIYFGLVFMKLYDGKCRLACVCACMYVG